MYNDKGQILSWARYACIGLYCIAGTLYSIKVKEYDELKRLFPATVGHDPQTSNSNQSQQQLQGGGWNGVSEAMLVSRSIRSNGNGNGNSNSNGWSPVTSPFQLQQQQPHERKQKEVKSGNLGDDEDGSGGGGGVEGTDPEENNSVHLKRRVGLVSGVALIVGTMIGIAIYTISVRLLYAIVLFRTDKASYYSSSLGKSWDDRFWDIRFAVRAFDSHRQYRSQFPRMDSLRDVESMRCASIC